MEWKLYQQQQQQKEQKKKKQNRTKWKKIENLF